MLTPSALHRFLPEQGETQQNGQDEDHFELAQAEEVAPVQYGLSTMGRNRGRQQNGSHPEASTSRPAPSEGTLAACLLVACSFQSCLSLLQLCCLKPSTEYERAVFNLCAFVYIKRTGLSA